MDTIWDEMDAMARIREAKRRKRVEARHKLAIALERARTGTANARPTPLTQILPRRRVAVRQMPCGLRAVDGPRFARKDTTVAVSLPFNSFIHEEERDDDARR